MNKNIIALMIVSLILASVNLAEAQSPGKLPRIGFLAPQSRPSGRVEAFRHGLRDLGYIEGQNIKIEYRGNEDRSQLAGLATELVREKVDVIVTQGGATRAAQTAVTVPIVLALAATRSKPAL